jgi:hypothetical protein
MDKMRDDSAFEEIGKLISEDKERALRSFRQGRFEQKVRSGIAVGVERKRSRSGRKAAVLASVASLILVAAGAVLFLFRRSNPIPQGGPGPMMAVLEELPGISDLVMPRETFPAEATDALGPAQAFRIVLTTSTQQKEEEERRVSAPTENLIAPRLSLEKKMEILFKDKAIERVLVRIFKKSEEV